MAAGLSLSTAQLSLNTPNRAANCLVIRTSGI